MGVAAGVASPPGSFYPTTSSLIVSGFISDVVFPPPAPPPNPPAYGLTKVDTGTLIFNNANANLLGAITVAAGVLDAHDSEALGTGSANISVSTGATLELEVDTNLPADPHGRDLTNDSLVGQTGNGPQLGLTFWRNLNLAGTGVVVSGVPVGALYSKSGINIWNGNIGLQAHPSASAWMPTHTHRPTILISPTTTA